MTNRTTFHDGNPPVHILVRCRHSIELAETLCGLSRCLPSSLCRSGFYTRAGGSCSSWPAVCLDSTLLGCFKKLHRRQATRLVEVLFIVSYAVCSKMFSLVANASPHATRRTHKETSTRVSCRSLRRLLHPRVSTLIYIRLASGPRETRSFDRRTVLIISSLDLSCVDYLGRY